MTSNSITELIAKASSHEPVVSGPAARELLQRKEECAAHIDQIVQLLQQGNAAIEDLAYRTLERIGSPTVPALLRALNDATHPRRASLLSLLTIVADFQSWFLILDAELKSNDEAMRFHAANCLARRLDPTGALPDDAKRSLEQSVELLRSCRQNPETARYWSQARMTLKQLGMLDKNAT